MCLSDELFAADIVILMLCFSHQRSFKRICIQSPGIFALHLEHNTQIRRDFVFQRYKFYSKYHTSSL